MVHARLSLVLAASAALALSGCGGSEPAPEPAETTTPAAETAGPTPLMPEDAPPQEDAPVGAIEAASCRSEIGEAASARLVERCIAVSPATRPPCHGDNPCALIQGEIERACAQYGEDRPAECAA